MILLTVLCTSVFGQMTATDWVKGAENLTSYSVKSSVTQTLKLNSGANATAEKLTTITENAETVAVVNMSSLAAHASGSTKNQMELSGQPANTSTTSADVYQIGNSTYVNDESGNWTHLVDPRSKQEVWGKDRNNQVKALAETLNLSVVKDLGTEAICGEDAYKLKIVTGSGDYTNLHNAAFAIAAKVTQYPMYLPSVNGTELNETGKIEKMVWISKNSYLPVKYHSLMSFSMMPEIIGALDPNTSQMKMFNQSIRLGEISVSIETTDLYYDFDKPTDITPPNETFIDWFNKGNGLHGQGKYDQSVEAYDEAIKLDPNNVLAWGNKGLALYSQNKYDEAINAFDEVIGLDPSNIHAWRYKGYSLYGQKKYDESVKVFNEVIRLDPNDTIVWSYKGHALAAQGKSKYVEAIEAYDEVIRLDPENADAWYNKGKALAAQGKYDKAIKAYDQVFKIDQNQTEYYWYLKGLALEKVGRNSEAKTAFAKVPYMPKWMEFVTFNRGQGFEGLLILYDKDDDDISCDGKLRIEIYDDHEYKKTLWSKSFEVSSQDFSEYTWGINREEAAWHLNRTSYDDVKTGAENPTWYVRAYFDSPDGSVLKDTEVI